MLEVLVKTNLILLSMVKKTLLILCIGLLLSSCFAIHPELQSAKSEDKGAHGYSLGVYGGANLLVETYGVAGFYNYGLTNEVDWSTDYSFFSSSKFIEKSISRLWCQSIQSQLGTKTQCT